ncbi:transketolase [Acidovorax phage ACPWH]|nr:transketolase [Acidovorax phage ACPWH]
MPKAIDLSTVSPERAARLLRNREQKKREYERRKEVIRARAKAWREANPDKEREFGRAWREANPERAAANKRADYERHRERRLANQARRDEDLTDAVVRSRVAHQGVDLGLTSRDIPDEVLPLFRTQMLIKRELRKQKAAS